MLNISNLFLSTIFIQCFYIDKIQSDKLLFENEQYLEKEMIKGVWRNIRTDGSTIGTSYKDIQTWKNDNVTEDVWMTWLYPHYKDAMVYRSLKYVYVLAHYGSMVVEPINYDKTITKFSTAVYTISNFFEFILLKNEVLENIRNISENFKYLPKKENSFPHFGIVTLFSEIIKIIDIFFEGEKLIQRINNGRSLVLLGGSNWDTYESIISQNLIDNKYYPPTEIKDKNEEIIEAINILITNVVKEYKIFLHANEINKEKSIIKNFIV
ncbi:uncharacterized protein LOC126910334 [Daktulosphaira vitifoliae]|uniref:uncharacterized protein LOC126910334 n=1 Tax=Daktulosphaira vitifoliae TaxID=58002 RepID=UPI0021AA830F|nr:uncharacterized protein LOC126910334 [Daktulosphaira vitifoliae]XP_050548779.1 uncharacterized protein LOC126910334 [Daktulosphaira vitifoliae]XP_050548781.1 uncharacterized protein LOC126910334 [Daktulosphaira vitifoliae]XP_050548782.1 uncharacterized protein LOC126910334 [Daktulosphaira vitifoliae]